MKKDIQETDLLSSFPFTELDLMLYQFKQKLVTNTSLEIQELTRVHNADTMLILVDKSQEGNVESKVSVDKDLKRIL